MRNTKNVITNTSDIRLALALFCLLTCLFILLSSAHIYIADGETAYQGTESVIERGTFALLEGDRAGDAPRAARYTYSGIYGITGPLQSLLAIPFYLLGSLVARAFPAPFHGYFTRFFVVLLNSPVHAVTVALLYLFGVDLGYRRRTALFAALVYAVGTIAWPYSRTFYADTLLTFWLVLSAWALFRYAQTDRWEWIALVGTVVGLGVTNKYVMAVAGPALAIYLLLEFWRRDGWQARWRWAGRTALLGGLPLGLIMGALFVFNQVRFGNPLETGYTGGTVVASTVRKINTAEPLLSLYGLFLSSGKGLFFYSPPVAASLWGVVALLRRRRNEAWLIVAIAASYPLFYSLTKSKWYGGGNWGPRHMVCITPFLILLVGAFLERRDLARWWRVGIVIVLFILGFWVQISTVFVNYDTYLFSDVSAPRQFFQPSDSPLLAQWRLWPRNVRMWQQYAHDLRASGESFYVLGDGFYDVEVPEMAPFGRWMKQNGRLSIYAQPEQALAIQVAYSRPRQADVGAEGPGLHLIYDGKVVISERRQVAYNDRETRWVETVTIPAGDVHVLPGTLEITATTWIPLEQGDPRELSVFIERVDVLSDGAPLAAIQADLPRPLPVSTAYPWSWEAMFWFYNPRNARPFDIWAWYVWTSGVPLAKARVFIALLALILGTGFAASSTWLVLAIKRAFDEEKN